MELRTERKQGDIILWHDESGIGLRFKEKEPLQRYNSQIVLTDMDKTTTEEGLAEIEQVSRLIIEEAERLYPMEFSPLQIPQ